jgi:uncharacterized protein (TIGR02118 family)
MDKVMLTLAAAGDGRAFMAAILEEAPRLVSRTGASGGRVNVVDLDDEALMGCPFLQDSRSIDAVIVLDQLSSARDAVEKLEVPAGARLVGAYRVEELAKREYERDWPPGVASPGINLICLVHRKPGMTWDAYSEHWRNGHGPLALRHQPGFWRYFQNHVHEHLTDDTPRFDGIGELHFRVARDAVEKMFDSPEGQQAIRLDTTRFMDNDRSECVAMQEHLLD